MQEKECVERGDVFNFYTVKRIAVSIRTRKKKPKIKTNIEEYSDSIIWRSTDIMNT